MMKIGIRACDLGFLSVEEIFERARLNEITSLQLPINKTFKLECDPLSDEVSTLINKYKGDVQIRVLSCYINPSCHDEALREKELNKFIEYIKFAPKVGAYMVGTETGSYNYDTSYHEWNETEEAYLVFKSSLKKLIKYANEYDVNIGIEPVRSHIINSPERVKRILEDINDDHLKIIFDPVNILNLNNYNNQEEVFKKCYNLFGDKVKALHIKDFIIENNKFKKVPIGLGILELEKVLTLFKNNFLLMESVVYNDIDRSMKVIKGASNE